MVGLKGKILITGGAGFLGRGIMRQAKLDGWDAQFTVYSRDEEKQVLCKQRFPDARFVLGDICDTERLSLAMLGHDYVIHAAALKYIPEGEFNAAECVRVNIDGARSVILAARASRVRRVVGISTDKAAQPVNIYGMTKAVMERLFAEAADQTDTVFTACRYGNVIGSTGSVVPVMLRQLAAEGKVKVTDPYMTRFWMDVRDAVDVIVYAAQAQPGLVMIPSPYSSTMHMLAHAVIDDQECTWVASNPEREPCHPKIEYTHMRPGEKLHEELISIYEWSRVRPYGGVRYVLLPPGNEAVDTHETGLSSVTSSKFSHERLVEMIKDSAFV